MIRALIVSVFLLVCPAIAAADTPDQVVTTLSGVPSTVKCVPDESLGGTFAMVWQVRYEGGPWIAIPEVLMQGTICGWVRRALSYFTSSASVRRSDAGEEASWWMGASLLILYHESMHIAYPDNDEGQTECLAYRNVWGLIKSLGFPPTLRRKIWIGVSDLHESSDADFRTIC